jgi:DNA-binding beta-propeller fold protein YncE
VTDQVDGTVAAFTIWQSGPNQGAPAPNGPPVPTGSGAASKPNRMAAHPNGRFLYVANVGDGTISAFSIVQSGANAGQLAPDGPPVKAGSMPQYLAVDPSGRYLYATNSGDSTVSAFTIVQSGPNSGQLVKNGTSISLPSPVGIAVDPSGQYAYVASDVSPGTLSSFRIVQSGAAAGQLVVNGPAAPLSLATIPEDVLVDALGLYVIVSTTQPSFSGPVIGSVLSITQTGPGAGQATNSEGQSIVAPFALGTGNLGFSVRATGRFISPQISDFWVAGGNEPSFVFEPLNAIEPPLGDPTAVAATN